MTRTWQAEACRLNAQGHSYQQISDQLRVSKWRIQDLLHGTNGHKPNPGCPVTWTPERIEQAILDFHAEHGRAPTHAEYSTNPNLPGSNTVRRNMEMTVAEVHEALDIEVRPVDAMFVKAAAEKPIRDEDRWT